MDQLVGLVTLLFKTKFNRKDKEMSNLISATFKTRQAAQDVLNELETAGVKEEQISVIVTDETRGNSFNIDTQTMTDEGTLVGAAAGGLMGAFVGALATASSIAIPGLNLVVAGSVVSIMAGIGAGTTAGGLVGALAGAGIPEHKARIYEDEIKDGGILLVVQPEDKDQAKEIENILERQDAYNMAA